MLIAFKIIYDRWFYRYGTSYATFASCKESLSVFLIETILFFRHRMRKQKYSNLNHSWSSLLIDTLKGTVSRDFRLLVFFMNQFPHKPHKLIHEKNQKQKISWHYPFKEEIPLRRKRTKGSLVDLETPPNNQYMYMALCVSADGSYREEICWAVSVTEYLWDGSVYLIHISAYWRLFTLFWIYYFFYLQTIYTVSTIQSVSNLYKLNIFTALTSLLVLKYGKLTSD